MLLSIIFQGRIINTELSLYATLIYPIIQIKKIYNRLYLLIIRLLWNELFFGKKRVENNGLNAFLFIVFLLLGVILYQIKNYVPYLILIFFGLFYCDYLKATRSYINNKLFTKSLLKEVDDGEIEFQTNLRANKYLNFRFNSQQVDKLMIKRQLLHGGAFETYLGKIWQLELLFIDGSPLVIHEDRQLFNLLQKATAPQKYFEKDLFFANADSGILSPGNSGAIVGHKTLKKWHIKTKWQLRNNWLLLKKIIQISGFYLFIVVMTEVLIIFGQIVTSIFGSFYNTNGETVIDLSQLFTAPFANWNGFTYLNLSLAILFMIYQGWQMSRDKHIYIDRYYLKYFIDNHKIDQISTPSIDNVLLIVEPELEIVILGNQKTLLVGNFQELADALALLQQIQLGLKQFQPATDVE
ncbi:MAG: hypothetical protein N5P05_003162 [Chroococcopsis gigantea SAG 12.99]|nr:hypothetical protein [Chroococcopsis gigantea SAG 12.99]